MREYMKFYIDGQWVDPVTPKSLDVINPATGEKLARVPLSPAQEVEKAVASAKVTAEDVARLTFDAIANDRFWILPHPQALDGVRARSDALLAGDAPADPYAALPQLRAQLVAALRAP